MAESEKQQALLMAQQVKSLILMIVIDKYILINS